VRGSRHLEIPSPDQDLLALIWLCHAHCHGPVAWRETRGLWPRLDSAEQNQDQENDDDKAQSAAAIIPGAVERTAAKAAEAAKQNDNQDDYKNCADRHEMISDFMLVRSRQALPLGAASHGPISM
jgi:hypothetical protein